MRPEIKIFIDALRGGKSSSEAMWAYCVAKSVIPIETGELERRRGDPFDAPVASWLMAESMAADAFDKGKGDDAIAEAFQNGMEYDCGRGVRYRPMTRGERPTFGESIRAMSRDEQMEAAKFFGFPNVAKAVAGVIR